jgi:hypothetical protein
MMMFSHSRWFVLLGWYLMMPPFYEVSGIIFKSSVRLEPDEASQFIENPLNPFRTLEVHPQAPLSDWTIESSYDSAAECETVKLDKQANSGWPPEEPTDIYLKLRSLREHESTCVSTDDPRLKEDR